MPIANVTTCARYSLIILSTVPMFLTTKLMPRSDNEFAEKSGQPDGSVGSRSHIEAVERFNDSVDDINNFFSDSVAADSTLGKLISTR